MISMISMISVACDTITAEFFFQRLFRLFLREEKIRLKDCWYIVYRISHIVDCLL